MSYIPPHLRNSAQLHRNESTTPSASSSSRQGFKDNTALPFQASPNTRSAYGLLGSRHAQPSAKPSPSRISRRLDSSFALESDPNDIKPRRNIQGDGVSGSTPGKGLLTDMELIGTVSRSGGVGDENDACVQRMASGTRAHHT